jgi:hypothetical protein
VQQLWEPNVIKTGRASRKQGPQGRSYITPYGYLPSVTTIREGVSDAKSKKRLEMWIKKNPGASEEASKRGTHIHEMCEYHLRKLPYQVNPAYADYWEGIPKILDQFSRVIWSERPMGNDFQWTIGSDEIARLWGHVVDENGCILGWAGCPDLIGEAGGKLTLADYKTSVNPYCRHMPGRGVTRYSDEWKAQMSGNAKFKKAALQIGAYSLASEETLGLEIEQGAIIVATKSETQLFILSRSDVKYQQKLWIETVKKYYDEHEIPDQDHPEEVINTQDTVIAETLTVETLTVESVAV